MEINEFNNLVRGNEDFCRSAATKQIQRINKEELLWNLEIVQHIHPQTGQYARVMGESSDPVHWFLSQREKIIINN